MCNRCQKQRATVLVECLAEYLRGIRFDSDCEQLLSWQVLLWRVLACTGHVTFLWVSFVFVVHKNRPFQLL
jgi:hypothetical protein